MATPRFTPGPITAAQAAYLTALARDLEPIRRFRVQPPLIRFEQAGQLVIGAGELSGGGGAGFHARITASELADGIVTYRIEETELDPTTKLFRAKSGDDRRRGPAYRGPTEGVNPPPIPVGQGVLAVESATTTLGDTDDAEDGDTGVYEITPWGGHHRVVREFVTGVIGTYVPNPADCTEGVLGITEIKEAVRFNADGLCMGIAPAGESEGGGT